jgi:two-component system, LuxR family, sensor kinase FixL
MEVPPDPLTAAAEASRMPLLFCEAQAPGHPIIFVNDGLLALTGYPRAEILGERFDVLMAAPDDARACGQIDAAFGGEGEQPATILCRRKDGTEFLASIYISPTLDEQGKVVRYCASLFDLTGQVSQSERDVLALHTLYENTPGFIAIVTGPDHRFTFVNASYRALIDRPVLGRTVEEALPELAEQGLVELLDRTYATGEPFVGKDVELSLGSGPGGPMKRLLLDFVYQPVRDSRNVVTGIFCAGQDVTDRAAAEERVQVLQRELIHASRVNAMSTMAATLAHELNQPLTAISNYAAACRAIVASGEATESLDRALVGVGEGARRAGDIIRRLREMTLGRATRPEEFDLGAAVEESLALVRAGACLGNVIEFHRPAEIIVNADRVQIQQVIMNLVRNACEAAGTTGARVAVTILVEGREARVAVDDAGPGVSPEAAERLFEWGDSTKPEGTGIGLSISRTIIEAHHGRIWHDADRAPGTRFCFTLPIAQAQPGPA